MHGENHISLISNVYVNCRKKPLDRTGVHPRFHTKDIFIKSNILPFDKLVDYNIGIFMFGILSVS